MKENVSENFAPERCKTPSQVRPVFHHDHLAGGGGGGSHDGAGFRSLQRSPSPSPLVLACLTACLGVRCVATAVAVDFFPTRGAKFRSYLNGENIVGWSMWSCYKIAPDSFPGA